MRFYVRTGVLLGVLLMFGGLLPLAGSQTGANEVVGDPDVLLQQLEDTLAELLAPQSYDYLSAGRRDPFTPLVRADGSQLRDDLPGVDDLIIVGVLWADTEYLALAETRNGRSLILRPGDLIRNGEVLDVGESGVVVRHSHYGVTRRVTLTIAAGEEKEDER